MRLEIQGDQKFFDGGVIGANFVVAIRFQLAQLQATQLSCSRRLSDERAAADDQRRVVCDDSRLRAWARPAEDSGLHTLADRLRDSSSWETSSTLTLNK
jgi:hypothetical protein